MSETALLVVDVQTGMIDGEMAVYKSHEMLKRIQNLILRAKQADFPIIYVQHDEAPEYDGPMHPSIAPQGDALVIHKMQPDAFHETDLQDILDGLGIKSLVIVGFQTNHCINATSRQAHERGYAVTVVEDAHSTVGDTPADAEAIIADYNQQFQAFARLVPAQNLTFATQLPGTD
jgi:nicotinamidase-related amidase